MAMAKIPRGTDAGVFREEDGGGSKVSKINKRQSVEDPAGQGNPLNSVGSH